MTPTWREGLRRTGRCCAARDTALLAAIKANRLCAPLFDTARYTRYLEAAYITIDEPAMRGEHRNHSR